MISSAGLFPEPSVKIRSGCVPVNAADGLIGLVKIDNSVLTQYDSIIIIIVINLIPFHTTHTTTNCNSTNVFLTSLKSRFHLIAAIWMDTTMSVRTAANGSVARGWPPPTRAYRADCKCLIALTMIILTLPTSTGSKEEWDVAMVKFEQVAGLVTLVRWTTSERFAGNIT